MDTPSSSEHGDSPSETQSVASEPATHKAEPERRPQCWVWDTNLPLQTKTMIASTPSERRCLCLCGGLLATCLAEGSYCPEQRRSLKGRGACLCMHSMRRVPGMPGWGSHSTDEGQAFQKAKSVMVWQKRPCDPVGFPGLTDAELVGKMEEYQYARKRARY